jgi:hypothetical protein
VVAAVVASAVVPTLIANAFFLPRHLLKKDELAESGNTAAVAPVNTGSVS